ncbi:hypothetical protein L218DRAFT_278631 [Marasmius fiardii PR-910]|nr:hypothetical protein L218DRAFT_278631 [Marasmius fiardii PR-910]
MMQDTKHDHASGPSVGQPQQPPVYHQQSFSQQDHPQQAYPQQAYPQSPYPQPPPPQQLNSQQSVPQQQPYPPQPYPPQPYPPQQQPGAYNVQQQIAMGEAYRANLYAQCAQGIHTPKTNYGVAGIILAVLCFPIGLICLFMDVERKCERCGIRM